MYSEGVQKGLFLSTFLTTFTFSLRFVLLRIDILNYARWDLTLDFVRISLVFKDI